jgi:aspartate/methionine/tyrosine aminotransferase
MEWAKFGYANVRFNLARSGVPAVSSLCEIPGGPFVPNLSGVNYAGHEGLKSAIAAMYDVSSDQVLVAQGASECNFLIAGAALADGGAAIVETPCYQPILRSIEVWADRIIRLPRRAEAHYQPDPDELKQLLTPDTKLVALTNLHNPTHLALEPDRLRAMVEAAERVGACVVCDEVYLRMFDPDHRNHGHASGAVSINSLGKTWGLDSLRVGWAVGPAELIHRAYRLNNLLGVNQPFMTEDLACQILNNSQATTWLQVRARAAADGWKFFAEFAKKVPGLNYVQPDGGISAFVKLRGRADDRAFTNRLIETRETVVFPCSFHENPGAVRVSYGGDPAETVEGLNRLAEALQELR